MWLGCHINTQMPFSETFIKTLNDFKQMCIQMEKEIIKLRKEVTELREEVSTKEDEIQHLRKLLTSAGISIESDDSATK